MNLFDILKDIITIKSGTLCDKEGFESNFSPYMIARYLSMDKDLNKYGILLNQMNNGSLSNKQLYLFLINSIPKRKNSFIKYITKNNK